MGVQASKTQVSEWKDVEFQKPPSPDIAPSYDEFLLTNAPSTLRYIPDFISEEDEHELIAKIKEIPDSEWIDDHGEQRKLNWGRVLEEDGTTTAYNKDFPEWADQIIDRVMATQRGFSQIARPEFFRVNEYQPGKGIRPHLDYQTSGPLNSIVTLASSCLLDFYHPQPEGVSWTPESLESLYAGSVWMEPRSLLFLSDQAFTTMLHGIKAEKYDVITGKVFNRPDHLKIGEIVPRSLRYSLTSRFDGKHDCEDKAPKPKKPDPESPKKPKTPSSYITK